VIWAEALVVTQTLTEGRSRNILALCMMNWKGTPLPRQTTAAAWLYKFLE